MTSTRTVLVGVRTHVDATGRRRPEFRLMGNPEGFWVERRRSSFIVDRVVQTYARYDTYWTDCADIAMRRFLAIPGVA